MLCISHSVPMYVVLMKKYPINSSIKTVNKKTKQDRIFTYIRDIICLPNWYHRKMTGNCIVIPHGNQPR